MKEDKVRRVQVLGVGIDDLTIEQAVEKVTGWLKEKGDRKYYIVTPNLEFLMLAQKDTEFKRILNGANLSVPDGFGLKLSGDIKRTVAGVDMVGALCEKASESGFRVGFLGGRNGVAKEAAKRLQKRFAKLKVAFAEDGPRVDPSGQEVRDSVVGSVTRQPHDLPTLLIRREPHHGAPRLVPPALLQGLPPCGIVFVGFGQGKQEKWISANLSNLPVQVAMGVGGSFDEIAGRTPRIPSWVQNLGIKWLVRLIIQPWRVKRQLALIKAVWMILLERSKGKLED